jgi:hypothetical protein
MVSRPRELAETLHEILIDSPRHTRPPAAWCAECTARTALVANPVATWSPHRRGSEMSSQRSPSARDVMRPLTALPTTTGVRESLEDRQTAGQVGRATMPGHEEVHCSACWKMAKPASDVLPPFAKHKLHRCSRRTLPHPTPRTGWPLPPCSMLNPKSPGNSGRGGVLKPLCTGISQKHPPSKETTGKHSRSSKPVWWACQDLNLGPHPDQQNAGNHYATRRSRRSRSTV